MSSIYRHREHDQLRAGSVHAISLVVSSIMIGVITTFFGSRTPRESASYRSIRRRQGDIGRVFNAETIIVGFTAGLIGIGTTALACIPVNAIVYSLFNVADASVAAVANRRYPGCHQRVHSRSARPSSPRAPQAAKTRGSTAERIARQLSPANANACTVFSSERPKRSLLFLWNAARRRGRTRACTAAFRPPAAALAPRPRSAPRPLLRTTPFRHEPFVQSRLMKEPQEPNHLAVYAIHDDVLENVVLPIGTTEPTRSAGNSVYKRTTC